MLTFLILAIGLEWLWNLQPYNPPAGPRTILAAPLFLERLGHYALVPLAVPWLIVAINSK